MATILNYSRDILRAPKTHQRVRLTVTVRDSGPWCVQDIAGNYRTVYAAGGNIQLRHSDWATPPFEFTAAATNTRDCNEPRLIVDPRGWLVLLYGRTISGANTVRERVSYSDGADFSAETVRFNAASHPAIAIGSDGTIVRAAYISGVIQLTRQAPGDASPGTAVTLKDDANADILVADDTFHFEQVYDNPATWLIHLRVNGETAPSRWLSYDLGSAESPVVNATAKRISEAAIFAGGTHPTVSVGPSGIVIWAAYVSGVLKAAIQNPGDALPGAAFTVKDDAAANLSAQNDQFQCAQGWEGPARWMLHYSPMSATTVQNRWSADEMQTTRLVT